MRTIKGEPTIREISPADDDRFVFRARVAQSWQEMQKILECPSKELGAPPPRLSRTGRMNAAGISVFYGAQDRNTSVAEKRGTVGSHVVVGRFEVIRTIQVLDLDVLAKVYVEGSHFDPEFAMQRGRAKFLGHLVEEISRPVMPGDEAFDYLPTQVVSEYLATRVAPKVDGIVFNSSQTGGVGRNLVLFNHASRAEPDDVPPGTGFTMLLDPGAEDDPNLNIAIFEEGPPGGPSELKDRKVVSGVPVDKRPPVRRDGAWLPDPDPIFRLDASSVQVLKIKAVSYDWSELSVTRHRRTEVQPR